MELQDESQVFWFFLSVISGKQTNFQAWIAQEIENSRHLSCISAGIRYYKKGQVNNIQLDYEFEVGNNEEYEIDSI